MSFHQLFNTLTNIDSRFVYEHDYSKVSIIRARNGTWNDKQFAGFWDIKMTARI